MHYTNFDCPDCAQNLEAPDDMAGVAITCPACHKEILVPVLEREEDLKDTTMRIELPPEDTVPPPHHRVVTIRRLRPR